MAFASPAVTTRGMKEADMKQVAAWIDRAHNDTVLAEIRKEVSETSKRFPMP